MTLETESGRIAKVTCDNSGVHLSNLLHGIEAFPKGVESIEVVGDFSDVFEEVKGLPPHREIEFQIDLVPGAIHVVQPSRRMAPRERRAGEADPRFLKERFDPTQFFQLRFCRSLCDQVRWVTEILCGLSGVE